MLSNSGFVLIVSTSQTDRLNFRDALQRQFIDSRQVDNVEPDVLTAYLDLYLTTSRTGPRLLLIDAESAPQELHLMVDLFRQHPLTHTTSILVYGSQVDSSFLDRIKNGFGVAYYNRPICWKTIAAEIKQIYYNNAFSPEKTASGYPAIKR